LWASYSYKYTRNRQYWESRVIKMMDALILSTFD